MSRFWKGFWMVADPKIWIASTVPMLVGTGLAYGMTGKFNLYWFIVSMIGLYFIEIGKNAANDLIDYLTGVDLAVTPDKITPFSGGRNRAIVNGYISLKEAALITAAMLAAGGLIGLYITLFHEPALFWIGTLGLFFAAAYSLPPFMLAYRGLGELVVGFTFGPLIVSGAFVVQAHFLTGEVLLASLPIGFLVANILFINQYPDYEADRQYNKRNWVVRLGKTKGLQVYISLFGLAYLSVVTLVVKTQNPIWLLSFISVPLVVQAIRVAIHARDDIPNILSANINTLKIYQINGLAMFLSAVAKRFL